MNKLLKAVTKERNVRDFIFTELWFKREVIAMKDFCEDAKKGDWVLVVLVRPPKTPKRGKAGR